MGEDVYEREFTVATCAPEDVPAENEGGKCARTPPRRLRIGFDLGASDRKVSAVVDGEAIYSEEVIWEPKKHSDPDYHYREVKAAIESAASKLPRVDAIGGSSAGIYVDNRAMIASLFRAIPKDDFARRARDVPAPARRARRAARDHQRRRRHGARGGDVPRGRRGARDRDGLVARGRLRLT